MITPSTDRPLALHAAGVRVAPMAAIALVLVAGLLAALPEWRPDWYQDDQLPVLFRVLHADLGHHHGVAYPRLAPELGFGYGRMLHQFYPPLAVEVAVWFHALGLGYLDATRATYSLCLLASGLGMYALGLVTLRGRPAAAAAAVAYVWAPYVLLDAHRGGVLGESAALAILPWAVLALVRSVRQPSPVWLAATAGGVAAINLAHNITALFFTGGALLYALILAAAEPGQHRRRAVAFGRACVAIVLGLALSAFYWAPAILELGYSNLGEQRRGSFSAARYLTTLPGLFQPALRFDYYSEPVPRYGLAAGLLAVTAIALFLLAVARGALGGTVRSSRGSTPDVVSVAACGLAFVATLLLQLRATHWIWESVPLISFAQFPQRLFVFSSLSGAIVAGTVPWSIATLVGSGGRASDRLAWAAGAAVAGILGLTSLPGVWQPPEVAASHRIAEDQIGLGTVAERRLSERSAYDDYFPATVEERATQVPQTPSANYALEYAAANDGPVPSVRLLERSYLRTRLETEAELPSSIVFHVFHFPGWVATVDGTDVPVEPVSPLGLSRVEVPPGRHVVDFRFVDTPTRVAATTVSLSAALALALIVARGAGIPRTTLGLAVAATAIAVPWAIHSRLAPTERPAPVQLEAQVVPAARLVALEIGPRPIAAGSTLAATLIWQSTAHTAADLQSGLRIEGPSGDRPVAESWGRPGRGSTPTGKWVVGELVPDPKELSIPPSTPPGRYVLSAGLRDRGRATLVPIGEVEIR